MKKTSLSHWIKTQLEDAKAKDITLLDVAKITTITDTMIICTGTSSRHVKSIGSRLFEDAKKAGFAPIGIEGEDTGEWVLVDLGDAIVHVMQQEMRDFYELEKLWASH